MMNSFDQREPPKDFSETMQALWWAKKGNFCVGAEWDKAHALCQNTTDALNLVHGFLHWIEGDINNANYWYSRAQENRQESNFKDEWMRLVSKFEGVDG